MKSWWVLVSALSFALMGVFVKHGSEHFTSAELAFYRSLVGVTVTAIIMRAISINFASPAWQDHVTRGVIGCVGLILYFYTMKILPLATAVTLNHTAPIFFVIFAAIIFNERLSIIATSAVAIGFIGVALLLRPTVSEVSIYGGVIGLAVGAIVAVGYLFIRRLGQAGEPELRTVFYYTLVCTIGAGLWMTISEVHPVTRNNILIPLGVGITATIGQLALTRAYKTGKSIITTSLTYTNVLFASVLGMFIWGETPSWVTWFAFLLIISSGILSNIATSSIKK